jgi:hypothetical protein
MSPQSVLQQELNHLRAVLEKYPKGALITEIEKEITTLPLERRTLQRRLSLLIDRQLVQKEGHGVSTRYSLLDHSTEEDESPIPLRDASKEAQNQIRKPVRLRPPIGYQRDFLECYRPNVTFYLSDTDRKSLSEIGQTHLVERASGTHAKNILSRLLIDLSWNSCRLEGNTYSLLETKRLIEFGELAEGKNALDAQMILNHKNAIEFLVQLANDISLDRRTILSLHGILSNNLLPDPMAEGRLRHMSVGIAHSVFEPLANPQQLDECFTIILNKANAIQDPFDQAFFLMVHLPYLQPFDDVNKRVSRLAANIPFLKHNLSPLSFVDVPDMLYIQGMLAVYELNDINLIRDVFLWAYKRSCGRYAAIRQSLGMPDLLKLKYHEKIKNLIGEILKGHIDYKEAAKMISNATLSIPEKDQMRFMEIVETELMSLHEGNFVRYTYSFEDFSAWLEQWNTPTTP